MHDFTLFLIQNSFYSSNLHKKLRSYQTYKKVGLVIKLLLNLHKSASSDHYPTKSTQKSALFEKIEKNVSYEKIFQNKKVDLVVDAPEVVCEALHGSRSLARLDGLLIHSNDDGSRGLGNVDALLVLLSPQYVLGVREEEELHAIHVHAWSY